MLLSFSEIFFLSVVYAYSYHSNLTLGGYGYIGENVDIYSSEYKLWLPIYGQDSNLIFSELRIFDRSGSSFEGNIHLGYRHIDEGQDILYGIYLGYDQRRSIHRHFYQQLLLGGELWIGNYFIGSNYYQPLGKHRRELSVLSKFIEQGQLTRSRGYGKYLVSEEVVDITHQSIHSYEESKRGIDLELGYNFGSNITSYLGGYYFGQISGKKILGRKIRLTYDYYPKQNNYIESIRIDSGLQYDKVRKTSCYIGISFRMGILGNAKRAAGLLRHMSDSIRRDPDIVVVESKTKSHETIRTSFSKYQELGEANGFYPLSEEELWRRGLLDMGITDLPVHINQNKFDRILNNRFRELVLHTHPDKVGPGRVKDYQYYVEVRDLLRSLSRDTY